MLSFVLSGPYNLAKNSLGLEGVFCSLFVRGGGDTHGWEGGDTLGGDDGDTLSGKGGEGGDGRQ